MSENTFRVRGMNPQFSHGCLALVIFLVVKLHTRGRESFFAVLYGSRAIHRVGERGRPRPLRRGPHRSPVAGGLPPLEPGLDRPRSERLSGRHRPGRPRRRRHGPHSPDQPRRQRKTGPRHLGDHPGRVAQSGKLWLPRSAKWLKAFIDELVRFTGRDDRADDQVDMTAYAAWQVRRVFGDPAPPLIEARPNEGSRAAELGMWGR